VTDLLLVLVLVLLLVVVVLLVGVIRRLRDHEARLAAFGGGPPAPMAPAGSRVEVAVAQDVDGRPVDLTTLGEPVLVGFFSPNCDACHERLPSFLAAADRDRAVAVVQRDGGDVDALVQPLAGAARVVVEPADGPLTTAFGVHGFPAFALVGADGTIAESGYEVPGRGR
jgi:thiol-disulfide isomerase/thioredoxin